MNTISKVQFQMQSTLFPSLFLRDNGIANGINDKTLIACMEMGHV